MSAMSGEFVTKSMFFRSLISGARIWLELPPSMKRLSSLWIRVAAIRAMRSLSSRFLSRRL